jgi:MATE family multidrug resistance protein
MTIITNFEDCENFMTTQVNVTISTGKFREFVYLFFPIALVNGSNYLFLFLEKIILGYFSVAALEAAISAAYACQIIQAPCVALAMMAQVYVGRCYGAQEWGKIGPGVWQFIWFSIFSIVITVPVSLIYGKYYFAESSIESEVLPYYYYHIAINFLYPLGMALSCYYLGQGKTQLVLCATLCSKILKLLFAYLLIFGVDGLFQPQGLMGGAYSTLLAQGGFCLFLLWCFLKSRQTNIFNNKMWKFNWSLFSYLVHSGVYRAFNRILAATSWAAIAYMMSSKGENYLLILSIGGTLFVFLPFLADAICQTELTIVSQILGAKNHHLLKQPLRSGMILVSIFVAISAIPLVLFPVTTYEFLFPTTALSDGEIRNIFYGVWISFACYTFGFIPVGYGLAYKDTKFSLFMGFLNWINGFLLMYVAIEEVHIAADKFWLALSLMHGSTLIIYFLRMQWLNKKEKFSPKESFA